MRQASRHSFAKALLVAAALHAAGAVVLALCAAGRALPVVDAGAGVLDVSLESPQAAPEEDPGGARARLADWTPQPPQADDMALGAQPVSELPVRWPRTVVPRSMVTTVASPPVAVGGPSTASVVVSPDAPSGTEATPGARADSDYPAATNTSARVSTAVGVDGGIVASGMVRPRYPASARMRGEEGLVAVTVETDDEGHAREVTVTAPSGFPALDRAAVDAARRTRFVSVSAGAPARGKALLSFRFRLVD